MQAIVVPFRGDGAKRRVAAPPAVRARLALAMLGDVVTACVATARTLVVTADTVAAALALELGAEVRADPGGGQGPAVEAALAELSGGPVLVVNADLPCVVPHDLRTLAGAAELGALGIVAARDGTTNALALPHPGAFAPLYGLGSAQRFRARAAELGLDVVTLAVPNLAHDVDRLADFDALAVRAGPRTQAALAALHAA